MEVRQDGKLPGGCPGHLRPLYPGERRIRRRIGIGTRRAPTQLKNMKKMRVKSVISGFAVF